MLPAKLNRIYSKSNQYQQAVQLVQQLQNSGYAAYLVGGCVRDLLLGVEPKDYDIATEADSDVVRHIFPEARGYGRSFGVSILRYQDFTIEIAAFRQDGPYYDHRRPAWVKIGTLEEDAWRRDFTVNALYYAPQQDELVDPVSGRQDLEARILRVIGDPFERLDEDWLRLLRAVRFAARFALRFDYRTWDALRVLAPFVSGVVAERRTAEIRLMLTNPRCGRALGLLFSSGLWEALWPDLPFSPKRMRKVIAQLKQIRKKVEIWKAFFCDLPEEIVFESARDLRLMRKEKQELGIP
ncbi:MAG: CCA tRNA nucleotidyltransferase [bacterium]